MTTPIIVPLGRRLTAVLDTGTHPATGAPLAGRVCGDCVHWATRQRPDGRTKCELADYHRGGPNIPAHTPACVMHHPADTVKEHQ